MSSKKGFFNIPIFKDYVKQLIIGHYLKQIKEGKHVLLIIDSAPSHKISELNEVYDEL